MKARLAPYGFAAHAQKAAPDLTIGSWNRLPIGARPLPAIGTATQKAA